MYGQSLYLKTHRYAWTLGKRVNPQKLRTFGSLGRLVPRNYLRLVRLDACDLEITSICCAWCPVPRNYVCLIRLVFRKFQASKRTNPFFILMTDNSCSTEGSNSSDRLSFEFLNEVSNFMILIILPKAQIFHATYHLNLSTEG